MSKILLGNVKGPSAYDVAVNEGFVGTEADWLASLVGDVTPEVTAAKNAAVAARDAALVAETNAVTAAAAAQAVGTTNDTIIAGQINTVGSATDVALDAGYATKSTETSAATAYTMAVKGFTPKTRPVSKMWAFPGVAGHGFTGAGSTGTVVTLDDTADFATGDRSVKVVTAGTGAANSTYASLTKTGLVIDATAKYARVWVKVDDVTRVQQLILLLGDNTFTNYFSGVFYTLQTEAKTNIRSGEWTAIDIPWSAFTTTGAPSRAAITAARLLIYDNGSTTGPATIRWGGAAGVTEQDIYPNGVVSLTFDDSLLSAYTVGRAYMDKYGYAGTLYPIIDDLGVAGKLSLAQAKSLMAVNGWDFGFHASSQTAHNTGSQNLTEAQFAAECEAMRKWAKDNNVRGDSFAWPLVTSNAVAERVAANYFRTARGGVDTTVETLPPSLPYRLRPILANSSASLASLQARIDKVKAGKGWGIITFHDIVAASPGANDVTTATFQGLIDYINTQGVAVATVGQVMDRI